MTLEKILDPRPISFQVPAIQAVHAVDGFRSEISHSANRRSPGSDRIAGAGRLQRIEHKVRTAMSAQMLFKDRCQRPGLPKSRGLIDCYPARLLTRCGRRMQFSNHFFGRHGGQQKLLEHRNRQRRHIGCCIAIGPAADQADAKNARKADNSRQFPGKVRAEPMSRQHSFSA